MGQFAGTVIISIVGLGLAVLFAFVIPFPANIAAPVSMLLLFGFVIYRVTKDDYAWAELDGDMIRAQHLYTRRVIERRVQEIEELKTVVLPMRTLTTLIIEAWLGRVKGITIKFRDQTSPIPIWRADPAMTNAQEFIEAVIFRMSLLGDLDADVEQLEGAPLVRRVFWKKKG